MIEEELIEIQTADNAVIALWKISDSGKRKNDNGTAMKQLFLTHGTFSDKKICMGIAGYLAKMNYTCWVMEWRSHGQSHKAPQSYNFETVALFDIKAVFMYLTEKMEIKNLSCLTHSGGGICLAMFLCRNPEFIPIVNSAVLFSCQAFGAGSSLRSYLQILGGKLMSSLYRETRGKWIGIGEHNEHYYTMKQWFNWNLSGEFKGDDDFDYTSNMSKITFPILFISGAGDHYIAPGAGCKMFADIFGGTNNEFLYCSKAGGFLEDYDHGRILMSRSSIKEIWPRAAQWLENHSPK